jgi:hypothetical protein
MGFNGVRSAVAFAGIALLVAAGSAFGTTLTFDDVPNEGDALYDENFVSFYEEQGVRVSSGSGAVAYDQTPGSLLVADSGTGFASDLTFTSQGTFSVQSLNIRSLGYTFSGYVRNLKDNIVVTGFANGSVVASATFRLARGFNDLQKLILGDGFTGLDSFVITLLNPYEFPQCDVPCGQFELDGVDLTLDPAPVPLPATAPLLAAGGLALFGLARRRRRA